MIDMEDTPINVLKGYMEENYFHQETDPHRLYNHAIIFLRHWRSDMTLQQADTIVREVLKGRKQ